jgi:hypothetical protein
MSISHVLFVSKMSYKVNCGETAAMKVVVNLGSEMHPFFCLNTFYYFVLNLILYSFNYTYISFTFYLNFNCNLFK